jgi:hypothetical protein
MGWSFPLTFIFFRGVKATNQSIRHRGLLGARPERSALRRSYHPSVSFSSASARPEEEQYWREARNRAGQDWLNSDLVRGIKCIYIDAYTHICIVYIYICIVYIYIAIIDFWKPPFLMGNHSTRWTSIVMSSYQRIKWSQWTVLLVGGWLWKDVVLKPPQRHECIKWKRLSIYMNLSMNQSIYLSINQSSCLSVCLRFTITYYIIVVMLHQGNRNIFHWCFQWVSLKVYHPNVFFPKEHDD